MEEKRSIEELLNKIHISTFNDESGGFRTFQAVIRDLANSWEVLSDDYKDELYEAMGIMPNRPKVPYISYPTGVRTIPLSGDTGIEYIQNQPTNCEV